MISSAVAEATRMGEVRTNKYTGLTEYWVELETAGQHVQSDTHVQRSTVHVAGGAAFDVNMMSGAPRSFGNPMAALVFAAGAPPTGTSPAPDGGGEAAGGADAKGMGKKPPSRRGRGTWLLLLLARARAGDNRLLLLSAALLHLSVPQARWPSD